MVWIDTLHVLPEQEANFFKQIFQGNNGVSLGAIPKKNGRNPVQRGRLAQQSLFVLWQSLYDSFPAPQRAGWDTYWGGWPGTGYSAFVQVNAPRYKQGLALLLDAPGGSTALISWDELWVYEQWDTYYDDIILRSDEHGGCLKPQAFGGLSYIGGAFPELQNRCSVVFDLVGDMPAGPSVWTTFDEMQPSSSGGSPAMSTGHHSIDVNLRNADDHIVMWIGPGDYYIKNLQLRKHEVLAPYPVCNTQLVPFPTLATGWLGWDFTHCVLVAGGVSASAGGWDSVLIYFIESLGQWEYGTYRISFSLDGNGGDVHFYFGSCDDYIPIVAQDYTNPRGSFCLDFVGCPFVNYGEVGWQLYFKFANEGANISNFVLKRII